MTSLAKQHTLAILVENKPSVLTRVAGLFARRAFNIHSLAVGPTAQDGISRMTIVTDATSVNIDQIVNQLRKLVYVLKIDVLDENSVEREIVLIKVKTDVNHTGHRSEVLDIVNLFRTRVVDITPESLIIEATGKASKLSGLITALKPYGITEIVKSGRITIARGTKTISDAHLLGD